MNELKALAVKGSPISVSGQLEKSDFVSQSFLIKSCLCFWPLRAAFKVRFVPVISVVDSDALRPPDEGHHIIPEALQEALEGPPYYINIADTDDSPIAIL